MKQFDAQLKAEFLRLLGVNPQFQRFQYGQVRRAAAYVIRHFGHEWALPIKRVAIGDAIEQIHFRRQLTGIIINSASPWHSNASMVKRRFFSYANRLAARVETIAVIGRIKGNLSK